MKSISISVVSHGSGELVRNLLLDLQRYCKRLHEVILTLNVPEDEKFLSEAYNFPLIVIRNAKPIGFGANHNQAFRQSSGDVFVICNPDIRIINSPFDELIDALDKYKGVVAPVVLDSAGVIQDSVRKFPTFRSLVRRVVIERGVLDYDLEGFDSIEVDWVAGMFVLFERETYSLVDGFDERYFMYMEDADICRRIRLLGYSVRCVLSTSVVHDAQRASHKSLKYLLWHIESAAKFLFLPSKIHSINSR